MDKVVILGAFNFVSFHVCKALLNKGIEVNGVHLESESGVEFIEEKRMEIGRNANFSEQSHSNWMIQSDDAETIIFSIYDLYMLNKEKILHENKVEDMFINYFSRRKDGKVQLVILVPTQMLIRERDEESFRTIKKFLKNLEGIHNSIQLFYLPTIYGRWQPDTFIFQHTILSEMNRANEFIGLREDTSDALYIMDVVESVIDVIENGNVGSYLLESEMKNQWNLCASYLKINEVKNVRNFDEINNKFTKVPVKNATAISEALMSQIELVRLLFP